MMKWKSILPFSVLGLAVLVAQADTLRLRDGRVINGTFLGANDSTLRFQRDNGGSPQRYDIRDVESVWFGDTSGAYNNQRPDNNPGTYNRSQETNQDRRFADRDQNRPFDQNRPLDQNRPYNDQVRDNDPARAGDRRYERESGNADRSTYSGSNQSSTGISSRSDSVLPAGSTLSVRTIDPINSDASHIGETYRASLSEPLIVNGRTVAPAGSDASIQIVSVRQGGRISGSEEVTLALASFTSSNGQVYNLNTNNENISSNSRTRQSAEVIGGGAALGAILGAVVGGGKGAAIGAASGAAIGTGAQLLRGVQVKVPAETILSFTLTHDLNL